MKRRNAESGKMRRPIKRNKITEGMYGNSLLYLKLVLLWASIVIADHMLEFRFEFLWPFWMMLRSVYDSFKYQGLAFSVFFICIALTSDMICYFFIPVQWMFIAASAYVWVQYIWYTDRGVSMPTVVLCVLLVYAEAAIRGVRDTSRLYTQGQLDLCRPFAAHCVGYPVVSLGFGVKSYVAHRLRLRRQREVQAENRFYYHLLRQALPETAEEQEPPVKESEPKAVVATNGPTEATKDAPVQLAISSTQVQNGHISGKHKNKTANGHSVVATDDHAHKHNLKNQISNVKEKDPMRLQNGHAGGMNGHAFANGHATTHCDESVKLGDDERTKRSGEKTSAASDIGGLTCDATATCTAEKARVNSKSTAKPEKKEVQKEDRKEEKKNKNKHKEVKDREERKDKEIKESKENERHITEMTKETPPKEKDSPSPREIKEALREQSYREKEKELQREVKVLNEELKKSRCAETDLKKVLSQRKQEHTLLKQAFDDLQSKFSCVSSARAALLRRVADERKLRAQSEHMLRAQKNVKNGECVSEYCRARRSNTELEAATLRRELQRLREEHNAQQQQQQSSRTPTETELTATELIELRNKAAHLERSLSAETRIKLDLFSALGDANRLLHIRDDVIRSQERKLEELKSQVAQMLAVMPPDSFSSSYSELDPNNYGALQCGDV